MQCDSWPFSGAQTLRILELAGPHRLLSAAEYVDSWLRSPEWEFKFAAFRWLKLGGSMEQACGAAVTLLEQLHSGFKVCPDSLVTCFWMEAFDDKEMRADELSQFITETCQGSASQS
jgi:hypothetical protein